MKLTKDNVLEKWQDAKLLLRVDNKEFIDLAEDSFIPFANLYDEFDDDMKKDFDQFLDTANKLLEKKEKEVFEKEPKYKVGDWVIVKVHMPDGSVQESFPLLITEVMVMPDGRTMYTEDGGQYDFFEDQIIRKTTAPNKKKEPKYKVGEWVISKIHTPEGVIESLPLLITEVMVMPDGKVVYNFDGGEIDVLEDEIIRKTTDPNKKKKVDAKDAKDYITITENLQESKESLTKSAEKKAESNGFGVDLKKEIEAYKKSVKHNDFDDMFIIIELLEICNFHTERQYFIKQDWKGLEKFLKHQDDVRKTTKPKKEPKAKEEKPKKEPKKKEKPTSNATPVEALSPEVKLIKRVITLQGKTMKKANSEKTNNPRAILNAIQRAIRTKQIRKTSKYADEIMYAQDALIRMVNGSLNGTMSGADVINFTRYDDLEKVAHSEVVSEAAKIAAQFIKIQEQAGKEKEAGTLLKRIEKSNEKGEEIDGMKKALKNYVDGKTTKLKASEQVLRGLHGIVDVNFESGDVVNSTTIEGKNFDTLDFHGRWEGFFGKPSPDFKFMFYGKPGNGKSTFALQFAGYLSKELGKSVLYVANEEGFGYTLQEKVKRLNVANSNLYLCDSVPEDLSQFDVVFLDSVNNLGLEPEDLKAMPAGKAYVYIFQTTKDGNYMGKQEFAHDVDTVVRVENMNAYKDKNRYGGEIQEFKVG